MDHQSAAKGDKDINISEKQENKKEKKNTKQGRG